MIEIIVIGAVIALFIRLVSTREAKSAAMASALCHGCVHVHKVKGYSGKVLLSCAFGSELRAVKFAVRECTGFCSNSAPAPAPVRVAGFVRVEELENAEAFPATVIRIGR
jgi:hypothetical protein